LRSRLNGGAADKKSESLLEYKAALIERLMISASLNRLASDSMIPGVGKRVEIAEIKVLLSILAKTAELVSPRAKERTLFF
jgi:hypothetical protein